MLSHGDRLGAVVSADRADVVRVKANAAKDDWRSLMDNLKQRESVLQVLLEQDTEKETSKCKYMPCPPMLQTKVLCKIFFFFYVYEKQLAKPLLCSWEKGIIMAQSKIYRRMNR